MKPSSHDHFSGTVLSSELNFYVSRHEKKKDKLDDEIKLAGLESLAPEELEKHLILNPIACELCRLHVWKS